MGENSYIGELAFSLVYPSEAGEGYNIAKSVKNIENPNLLKNLDKETIISFLEMDDTKLKIVLDKRGKPFIYAHNRGANESVQIDGLGDHFLALTKMVVAAEKYREESKYGNAGKLITHEFVQKLNRQLLSLRSEYDEAAIGEYRYLDCIGRPYPICLTKIDDNGVKTKVNCANIAPADDENVIKKMEELLDWVNNVAFKDGRDVLEDVAQFHARFVQIQPFADGNKRTARLLTNYILLINNMPLVDINEENRAEYLKCIYYASANNELEFRLEGKSFKEFDDRMLEEQGERTEENKYLPLKRFFERNCIKGEAKKVIEDILRYDPGKNWHADQVM